MADTYYIIDGIDANGFNPLQRNGTAPTTPVTTATGWTTAKKTAVEYQLLSSWNAVMSSANFTTTVAPAATDSPANVGVGAHITPQLTGTYAAGNWTFKWSMISSGAAVGTGAITFRVWKSANANASGAVEITSAMQTTSTISPTTTTAATASATVSMPAITLNGEYLFIVMAWEITVAGSSNSSGVRYRASDATNAVIKTTSFTSLTLGWGQTSYPQPYDLDHPLFTAYRHGLATRNQFSVTELYPLPQVTSWALGSTNIGGSTAGLDGTSKMTFTTTGSIPANALAVLVFSMRSSQTTSGADTLIGSVTLAGNNMTLAVSECSGNASNSACTSAIYYYLNTGGTIASGATVTINTSATASNTAVSQLTYFTYDTSKIVRLDTGVSFDASATTPSNVAITGSATAPRLWIRLAGAYSTGVLTFTQVDSSGWSDLAANLADSTNSMGFSEYKIDNSGSSSVTSTLFTNNLSNNMAWASVGVGFFLSTLKSVAVSIAGPTSLGDNLVVARKLVDSIAGATSVTDALTVARKLVDAITGTSSVSDNLVVSRKMADSISGTASVTDSIVVARKFVEAVASSAAIADTLNVTRPLADAISGHTTVSDPLSVKRSFADSIFGSTTTTDNLAVARKMSDSVTGSTTVTDSLIVARKLVESIAASSSIADALKVNRPLTETISGHTVVTDPLAVKRNLVDTISQSASVSDTMIVSRKMTDSIASSTTVADALAVLRPLTDSIHSSATVSDPLSLLRTFTDTIIGSSTVTDPLSVKRNEQLNVAQTTSVVDAFIVARKLALAASPSAVVTSTMAVKRVLVESILGLSTLNNNLAVTRALADVISAHTSSSLDLKVLRSFTLNIHGVGACSFDLSKNGAGTVSFVLTAIGHTAVIEQLSRAASLQLTLSPTSSTAIAFSRLVGYIDSILAHSNVVDSVSSSRGFSTNVSQNSALSLSIAARREFADNISSVSSLTALLEAVGIIFFQMIVEGSSHNLFSLLSFLPGRLEETTPSSVLTHSFIDSFISSNEDVLSTSVRLMKQGDNSPPYSATLSETKDNVLHPVDLTGYTVTFVMVNSLTGAEVINRPCTIDDAVNGKIHYDWQAGDTATVGQYKIVIKATNTTLGITRTFPQNGYASFIIEKNL